MKTRKTIISILISIFLMSVVLIVTMVATNRQVKATTCMQCKGKGTLCTGTVTKSERSSTFEDHNDWNCPYIGVETSDFKVYYRHCSGCDKSDRIFVGTCPGCGRTGTETEFSKHPKCGMCGGKGYVGEDEPECSHSNWNYEYNSNQHRRVCTECGQAISDWAGHTYKNSSERCDFCPYVVGSGSTDPDPGNPGQSSEYCPDGQHEWKCVGGLHHECTKCPATGACNPTETAYRAYDSVKHFSKRCPVCKGCLTGMEEHTDESPKDGKCDKCGYSMCDHSGGNHENGGVCEKCGQVYETHKRSSTVLDYIHRTETQHIPRYKCTCPGCDYTYTGDPQSHVDTNPKDGVCDYCGYSSATVEHGKGKFIKYEYISNGVHHAKYECKVSGCNEVFYGEEEDCNITVITEVNEAVHIGTCSLCGNTDSGVAHDLKTGRRERIDDTQCLVHCGSEKYGCTYTAILPHEYFNGVCGCGQKGEKCKDGQHEYYYVYFVDERYFNGDMPSYDDQDHYLMCIKCSNMITEGHTWNTVVTTRRVVNIEKGHTLECTVCGCPKTFPHTMASSGDYNYCTTEGCGYKEPISGKSYSSESCSVSKKIGTNSAGNRILVSEFKFESGKVLTASEIIDNNIVDVQLAETMNANGEKVLLTKLIDSDGNVVEEKEEARNQAIITATNENGKTEFIVVNNDTGDVIKGVTEDGQVNNNVGGKVTLSSTSNNSSNNNNSNNNNSNNNSSNNNTSNTNTVNNTTNNNKTTTNTIKNTTSSSTNTADNTQATKGIPSTGGRKAIHIEIIAIAIMSLSGLIGLKIYKEI